ncbi:MAG: amino-acid N-acetyltransferase [Spirochaetaceae bacterium]|jgi:amino-acid N-acetyltransferase|nr:amino-acid N-acetyltransferase [Spirochaetaceae bacterium]
MTAEVSSMNLVREAFLYQNRFNAQTIVFKIEYPVTEAAGFPYLMKDIGLLAKSGIRVVIVPGAAEYIDVVLANHKRSSAFVQGERRTVHDEIPYVEMAAFHAATRFITGLSAAHVDALIGNFVRARGRGVVNGIDMENTGSVDKIFTQALTRILDFGMVPILPCIGWSPTGKPYNVSSNEIAVAVSAALGAIKLVIVTAGGAFTANDFTAPDSVEYSEDGRILHLSPEEAALVLHMNEGGGGAPVATNQILISRKPPATIKERSLEALRLALEVSKAGVERVHIVNGWEEGVILSELFSNFGAGTMVYADEYEAIRGIRTSDIPDMLRLMEPLMQKGILRRRNAEDIQKKKDDFVVFVIDGTVHGCAALHRWGEGQAEIAALVAGPAYSERGIGRRLVRYLIEKAKRAAMRRVFVLTVSTQDWFETLGFSEAAVETLPDAKRKHYDYQRKSKIFALSLAPLRLD